MGDDRAQLTRNWKEKETGIGAVVTELAVIVETGEAIDCRV